MGRIVKVKCNGPNQCVNEVDLDKALETTSVVRAHDPAGLRPEPPERVVLRCKSCTPGRVILTRRMIAEMQKQR